jgi:hypothetical protein
VDFTTTKESCVARTAAPKIKVKSVIERTITLPPNMVWGEGEKFILHKKNEAEWLLEPERTEAPTAA